MADSKLERLLHHTAWLGALAGALVLALAVGLSVWLVMSRQYGERFDKAVQAGVDEQMAAMGGGPPGAPPTEVKVASVVRETVQDHARVVGRLREVRRAVVASEVEGRVLEVRVDVGDRLVGGETVIARVDDVWAALQVEQAEADLGAAQARADQTRRELAHLESLAARNASDQRAIDDAKAAADADAAEVQARLAALHRAQVSLERVEIVAPFDGYVTKKQAEQGQWLDPGGAVVEMVSSGAIDAEIDVPEMQVGGVQVGMPIEVWVEALDQTLVGTVAAVSPDGSSAARSFPVKVRLDNPDGALKVGMSVVAQVPLTAESAQLIVPRDAVSFTAQGAQVWVVGPMPGAPEGGLPVALPVDVEVLFGVGERFAVEPLQKLEGLTLFPGMPVVVEGAEQLWPTRPAIVTNPQAGGGAGPGGPPQGGEVPSADVEASDSGDPEAVTPAS
ncbi:MAG: efflux RND transporter periplasmic adaptor subunit [Planctomycetota bacterium]